MLSANVINGSIGVSKLATNFAIDEQKLANDAVTSDKIKDGAVTIEKLAPGAITSAALAPSLDLGSAGVCGVLDLFSTDMGTPGLTLNGCQSEISAFIQTNAAEAVELKAFDFGGLLSLRAPNSSLNLQAGSAANGGGFAYCYNDTGRLTVRVDGSDFDKAGYVSLANSNGLTRVFLDGQGGNGGGEIVLNSATGRKSIQLLGAETNYQTGAIFLFQGNGVKTIEMDADLGTNGNSGSTIYLANGRGTNTIVLDAQESSGNGGDIKFYNGDGGLTVEIDGDDPGHGGWIGLYDENGRKMIELDANHSGGGRVTTRVLEITDGSDLSENFDIKPIADGLKEGMIVCIDPEHSGQLTVSTKSYDHTVAGIVSGAGGIKTGMLMSQRGTVADGKHPVALTGRVYCWMDADQGTIRPGDLITTSDTPGHGMKASDPQRSHGAIIGKAMTNLEKGKGLVLVLVSLQ